MNNFLRTILITGGAGFIGSHVVKRLVKNHPESLIINVDKLTYAGNLLNLTEIESEENYLFIRGDITNLEFITELFSKIDIDYVIHLAAESHVDRSISSPLEFVNTNILGTAILLQTAKSSWEKSNFEGKLFYHISTDEVYGSLTKHDEPFKEDNKYDPHSPYSASKAGADHLVRAYFDTYKMPVIISNCSNNYGPNQFPEKLIPLVIHNCKNNIPIPIYGQGTNVRDWLYVEDHAAAIESILNNGIEGQTYNIGGSCEVTNLDLVKKICTIMDGKLNRSNGETAKLITFVKDRPGHDLRYAIDHSKITNALSWKPEVLLEDGLERTIDWYVANQQWITNVLSGEYQEYYQKQYHNC